MILMQKYPGLLLNLANLETYDSIGRLWIYIYVKLQHVIQPKKSERSFITLLFHFFNKYTGYIISS